MALTINAELPPLRVDDSGAVRVGETRVVFALVVRAFQRGESPEAIVRMFRTLDLGEVYGAIAYYLRHRPEVEAYLAEYDRQGEEVRKKIEARQGSQAGVRDGLLSRLATKPTANGSPGGPALQPDDGGGHDHGETSGR
jgi:uncharacterized protein (DUF433 family)